MIKLPAISEYKNRTVIAYTGKELNVEQVSIAGIIAGLNVLLLGEKGMGKTQLMRGINNKLFNGNGTSIRAHPDLRVKDVYEKFSIEDFQTSMNGLVENVFTEIDEINRAPTMVQNELFHICDGYILFKGKRVELGKGFHSVMASANMGYAGTFDMDDALRDRFHVTIDLNEYPTTSDDDLEFLVDTFDPRPKDAGFSDHVKDILLLNQEVRNQKFKPEAYVTLLYLMSSLDYCERSSNKSKLSVIKDLPNLCDSCNRLGSGCGYIKPGSKRTVTAVKSLAASMRLIADIDGEERNLVGYEDVLEAFGFVAPYSGMFNEQWVAKNYHSSDVQAVKEVKKQIRADIESKMEYLATGLSEAMSGNLKERTVNKFTNHWKFYTNMLTSINNNAKQYGSWFKNKTDALREDISHPVAKILK